MSDIVCKKCQGTVDKDNCFQCVENNEVYYECAGEIECSRIAEERKVREREELGRTRRERFMKEFSFDMDELVKIGVLFRDACIYYRRGEVGDNDLEIYSTSMLGSGDFEKVPQGDMAYKVVMRG